MGLFEGVSSLANAGSDQEKFLSKPSHRIPFPGDRLLFLVSALFMATAFIYYTSPGVRRTQLQVIPILYNVSRCQNPRGNNGKPD